SGDRVLRSDGQDVAGPRISAHGWRLLDHRRLRVSRHQDPCARRAISVQRLLRQLYQKLPVHRRRCDEPANLAVAPTRGECQLLWGGREGRALYLDVEWAGIPNRTGALTTNQPAPS